MNFMREDYGENAQAPMTKSQGIHKSKFGVFQYAGVLELGGISFNFPEWG
jgi:hypothetical protein